MMRFAAPPTSPSPTLSRRGPSLSPLKGGEGLFHGEPIAVGGLICVEHSLDLLGVGRLGQRQRQQDTGLLRVERI
jgi:hypothetical protein